MGDIPFQEMPITKLVMRSKRARHIFATNGPERGVFKVLGLRSEDILTPDIIDLFGRAFDLPRKKKLLGSTPQRPDAGKWAVALAGLANQLAVCPKNAAHHYIGSAKSCPWCALEKRGVPKFFNAKIQQPSPQKVQPPRVDRLKKHWPLTRAILLYVGELLWKSSVFLLKVIYITLVAIIDFIAELFGPATIWILELLGNFAIWLLAWSIGLAVGVVCFLAFAYVAVHVFGLAFLIFS